MKFKDREIEQLDLTDPNHFSEFFIYYICGKSFDPKILTQDLKKDLKHIIEDIKTTGLNYGQFNEILLLLNQNRISLGFFNYFFGEKKVRFEDLKKGVEKLRGYSLLHFGNFKFTFKELSKKSEEDIRKILSIYEKIDIASAFLSRPDSIIETEIIPRNKTCYLGYLSGKQLKKEMNYFEIFLEEKKLENKNFEDKEEYNTYFNELSEIQNQIIEFQKIGLKNTRAYLIWDYLDVYIATSMRDRCEFEETYDFLIKLRSYKKIEKLKLRFFDPTKSFCALPRDKGLIEGLMLRRANCTIYMVQESDTIGKDSELASTLAQKKSVIAYVPEEDLKTIKEKIDNYPLDYIKKKILQFKAEGVFDNENYLNEILSLKTKEDFIVFQNFLMDFVKKLDEHRRNQPFTYWEERENEFKNKERNNFQKIFEILAIAIKFTANKRANLLKELHPLGMQVDLNTGVANGIIVVRNIEMCSDILEKILTNTLNFEIRREKGFTGLYEAETGSLYRIITENKNLTKSFWNFYNPI